jgi:hypothetical protein
MSWQQNELLRGITTLHVLQLLINNKKKRLSTGKKSHLYVSTLGTKFYVNTLKEMCI